jgi:hypothetical protein
VLHHNPIINALLVLLGIGVGIAAICFGGVLLLHFFLHFPTVGALVVSSVKFLSVAGVIAFVVIWILFAIAS